MRTERKIYRSSSLERLSTPDQLDQLLSITSPRSWIATGSIGLLLVGVVLWGVFGRSLTVVEARGLLIPTDGAVKYASAFGAGRLSDLRVAVGDVVEEGETLARVSRPDHARRLINAQDAFQEVAAMLARQKADAARERDVWEANLEGRRAAFDITRQVAQERISYLQDKLSDLESDIGVVVAIDDIASIIDELGARRREIAMAHAELQQFEAAGLEAVIDIERQIDATRQELENHKRTIALLEVEDAVDGRVVAPLSGQVVELVAQTGSRVSAGQAIVGIASGDGELGAVVYVPYQSGKKIHGVMDVRVSPHAVRREEYGSLLGTLVAVSSYPVSPDAMQVRVANQMLVDAFTGGGASYEAHVALVRADTPSGYAWTSGSGPALSVTPGTTVDAEIIVRERRPVDLIIPFVRSRLGVGG